MENTRGFISIGVLMAIILGIVAAGGGAYYVSQQHTAQQRHNTQVEPNNELQQTQTTTSQPKASASFNIGTLTTTSPTPIITGTCKNISGPVAITIISGKTSLPANNLSESAVYTEYTDHGGQFDAS
jgi:hypothetical protein